MTYPNHVDLLVLGTGLVQSIIACAAARQGKSVFIIDSNTCWGETGASLTTSEFSEWLRDYEQRSSFCAALKSPRISASEYETEHPEDKCSKGPSHRNNFRDVEILGGANRTEGLGPKFCFDLVHQALESTGPCIQAIRNIGLHHILEFAAVTTALTLHQGQLCSIPASRADVHAASWLDPEGKRNLNLFLTAAQQAAAGGGMGIFETGHFKQALEKYGVPEAAQDGLLYMVHGLESKITSESKLSGEAVLESMVKYMTQSGAYVAGQAPFVVSRYSCAEVSQAFVRNCCAHQGMVALASESQNRSVTNFTIEDGKVKGVQINNSDVIMCSDVVGSYKYLWNIGGGNGQQADGGELIARAIVVLTRPLVQLLTTCKIVIPPDSCGHESSVTVWHCPHTLERQPEGNVQLYMSTRISAGKTAREVLEPCLQALLSISDAESSDVDLGELEQRHDVRMACFYTQILHSSDGLELPENVSLCSDVGGSTTMDSCLLEAEEIFAGVYPGVAFLVKDATVADAGQEGDGNGDDLDAALRALGMA